MNEKAKILGVLGSVIVVSCYIFNEIFMMFFTSNAYIPEGPYPHSMPPIVGTAWLIPIPFGFLLLFASLIFEMRDRFRRTDSGEIWR